MKNASKELLHGSHTRAVSISTPSNSGIMKFAKKQLTCLGCKAVIRYGFQYKMLSVQSGYNMLAYALAKDLFCRYGLLNLECYYLFLSSFTF